MRITTDNAALTVTFEGMERVWALKRQLVIPRQQIADISWHEHITLPLRAVLWRMGGTAAGILFAGRFFGSAGKSFLYLTHAFGWFGPITAPQVLELQLRGNYFDRLFFTVTDQALVQRLLAWQHQRP